MVPVGCVSLPRDFGYRAPMSRRLAVPLVLAAALAVHCGSPTPCDPLKSGSCSNRLEACEPATRTCVSLRSCKADSECKDGFGCFSVSQIFGNYCMRNCTNTGDAPSDLYCAPGFRCEGASRTCRSVVGAACKFANGYDDCNGPNCDAATGRCVANRPCTMAGECADGYGCGARGCYRFCNVDASTCQDGRTCAMASGRCQ